MNKSCNKGIICGNSLDLRVDPCSEMSEIRADITVEQYIGLRVWGQISDQQGIVIAHAQVKLVKIIGNPSDGKYQGIAHTTTDEDGFYQFEIYYNEPAWYKILVGKSNTGKEIIIDAHHTYEDDDSL